VTCSDCVDIFHRKLNHFYYGARIIRQYPASSFY
jgi:hypothetical protein